MDHKFFSGKGNRGFTLIELLTIIGIIAVLVLIAIPSISNFLPGYRLKKAAQDLYGNMQAGKMQAIKDNRNYNIVFDDLGNKYTLNGTRVVSLSEYGSGITFGSCNGETVIEYNAKTLTFTSKGLCDQNTFEEWVYLKNNKNRCYKVGTSGVGLITMRSAN